MSSFSSPNSPELTNSSELTRSQELANELTQIAINYFEHFSNDSELNASEAERNSAILNNTLEPDENDIDNLFRQLNEHDEQNESSEIEPKVCPSQKLAYNEAKRPISRITSLRADSFSSLAAQFPQVEEIKQFEEKRQRTCSSNIKSEHMAAKNPKNNRSAYKPRNSGFRRLYKKSECQENIKLKHAAAKRPLPPKLSA